MNLKSIKSFGKRLTALSVCTAAAAASVFASLPEKTEVSAASADDYFLRGAVVNKTGVNASDAVAVQQQLAKMITFDENQFLSADVDESGEVNVADVVNILCWAATMTKYSTVADYARIDGTPDISYDSDDMELIYAQRKTEYEGFNGPSYVAFDPSQVSTAALNINADIAGSYKLRIRYANGGDNACRLYVSPEDGKAVDVNLAPTGSWSDWSVETVVVELKEGDNTVRFITAGENGGTNLDTVTICRTACADDELVDISGIQLPELPTEPPVPTKERYYAIESEYVNGISETLNAGFAGEAYLNYDNSMESYNIWTVNVPEDGNYLVTFRFANGTDTDREMKLSINGISDYYLQSFPGTGAWTEWAENTVVLPLRAGDNTIKAKSSTANGGPNMDYIELEKTDREAVSFTEAKDGRQVENLSRGVSAAYSGNGVLVSWRILATDSENTTFKLYKNGQTPPVYESTVNDASNYFDASGTPSDVYTIDTFVNGEMTEFAQASINLGTKNSGQSGAYFDIPIIKPDSLTMPDGTTCTYSANDASVGDADGDGEYEIFLKWDPSNSQDNSKNGYTGNVYIDCYKLNGTRLWRVDLGKNIRAGAHYTQFMVYDYDGDGYAEMVCKTADGTVDGTGNTIGNASMDYRSSDGRILSGPEYLTLFDGRTGAALDTIDYKPGRGTVSDWGDSYGNRVDRFTAATAYLDGQTPSVVMGRGYYTRMALTAYDVVNKKLVERWAFDTGHNSAAAGYGNGNHNLMPADVDGDGKDELVTGAAVIDDNGSLLYSTGFGHGDAMHVGDLDPNNPGLEIFMCHEEGPDYGISLRDGKTGNILFRETATGDTGRCVADNLIAGNAGAEFCGSHNGAVYTTDGTKVCDWSDITKWGQNSLVYWTDTLERAVLDRTMIDQYGKGRVFTGDGASYNNASKSNACITCDLFGDWREELVFPANDSTTLRVFATTYTTEYNMFCLMDDTQYRCQVAGQNVAYNQPPHTKYFLESGKTLPETPEVYAAK